MQNRFSYTPIQFRKNYNNTTMENLTKIDVIDDYFNCKYGKGMYITKEEIRNNIEFKNKYNIPIYYHKTLPYSKLTKQNDCKVLFDIIINQKGEILDDWNEYGKPLDLELYENRLTY